MSDGRFFVEKFLKWSGISFSSNSAIPDVDRGEEEFTPEFQE